MYNVYVNYKKQQCSLLLLYHVLDLPISRGSCHRHYDVRFVNYQHFCKGGKTYENIHDVCSDSDSFRNSLPDHNDIDQNNHVQNVENDDDGDEK